MARRESLEKLFVIGGFATPLVLIELSIASFTVGLMSYLATDPNNLNKPAIFAFFARCSFWLANFCFRAFMITLIPCLILAVIGIVMFYNRNQKNRRKQRR